jgi:hypothetical protein
MVESFVSFRSGQPGHDQMQLHISSDSKPRHAPFSRCPIRASVVAEAAAGSAEPLTSFTGVAIPPAMPVRLARQETGWPGW